MKIYEVVNPSYVICSVVFEEQQRGVVFIAVRLYEKWLAHFYGAHCSVYQLEWNDYTVYLSDLDFYCSHYTRSSPTIRTKRMRLIFGNRQLPLYGDIWRGCSFGVAIMEDRIFSLTRANFILAKFIFPMNDERVTMLRSPTNHMRLLSSERWLRQKVGSSIELSLMSIFKKWKDRREHIAAKQNIILIGKI